MCCRKGKIADNYKESRGLRCCLQTSVSIIVLAWLTGLVVGPILLLRGHCDEFPTVNQTQIFQMDECIEVLDNACKGMVIVTGYFDAVCDGKNFTGTTHVACFTHVCIKSQGVVKMVIERNYYSTDPNWMWWVLPGIMVYLWWTPVIFIAILITRHLIHRFFVREDERLEEVAVSSMAKYTVSRNDSSDDDSTAIPMVLDDPKTPRIRDLTPPTPRRKKSVQASLSIAEMNEIMNGNTRKSRHSVRRNPYPDHRILLEKEIEEDTLRGGYSSFTTSGDDGAQSGNVIFKEMFSGPGTDYGYTTNEVPDLTDAF